MKRTGIRILLSIMLLIMLVMVTVIPVSAGPPQKVFIEITGFDGTQIHYHYSWNHVGAKLMHRQIFKDSNTTPIWNSWTDLGGRTPSADVTTHWSGGTVVEAGHTYTMVIELYRDYDRPIKNASDSDTAEYPLPPS